MEEFLNRTICHKRFRRMNIIGETYDQETGQVIS